MRLALEGARAAGAAGDVPVGAVVLDEFGVPFASGWNEREVLSDPTAHAEVVALREAARLRGSWRLSGCTLVVSLEPCVMCAGAAVSARVSRVVFGAWDEKAGAVGSVYDVLRDGLLNHSVEVVAGVLADECGGVLREFFEAKRGRR